MPWLVGSITGFELTDKEHNEEHHPPYCGDCIYPTAGGYGMEGINIAKWMINKRKKC